ncbi:unnamed protein product [Rotaria sp. Silwood1]|nr:unnamed protein product [Rotaria sp. Silwood1]CAF1028836.1 unnamed protein product [Rotaria sp. Silwood1]CAF3436623.1 unnamed protein product [Rotaria sp. Silwood1]CAF4574474.1 unnamed protein product [Rotaria sp. Silwood1]CAF4685873.1 unnamed protein product [Rotaria sp. Silwood1]
MNSNSDRVVSMIEIVDDGSTSIDDDIREVDYKQQSRTHIVHSSAGSTSSTGTGTNTGTKRQKDISPCYVCGAKANGYNFDQITCESCKAFFRRNALKSMDKFRCRNNDNCVVTSVTRKRCKRCRLAKCFKVGMRKEWILTDEEKTLKRQKIVRNRMMKQAQMSLQQQTNGLSNSNIQTDIKTSEKSLSIVEQSLTSSSPIMYMKPSPDQQLYERQQYLLDQLSNGYQLITKQYPQPNKFVHRNKIIYQTENFETKLSLIKDLTRELTQMTTLRLLNYFNLIPEFQLLTQQEKKNILTQNMLTVFMFHGALTYNADNDTCVDRTTADDPYDAKYLLYVYGTKIYTNFVALAKGLTSVAYESIVDKHSEENSHTLFLLLMVILLFSNGFHVNTIEDNQSKLKKIQQTYMDITFRFLHDQFGLTNGRRIFQKLVPLLIDLQKLCSTLANVNLCEMAEDDDRSVPSRASTTTMSTYNFGQQSVQSSPISSSLEFNSTMISGRSHLNELQKENRAPSPPPPPLSFNSRPLSPNVRSSPSILSNTTPTLHNYSV